MKVIPVNLITNTSIFFPSSETVFTQINLDNRERVFELRDFDWAPIVRPIMVRFAYSGENWPIYPT